MTQHQSLTKHQHQSALTREKFIEAGQRLIAERGIDGVSISEITQLTGQKNRNALQYHFGSKQGLLHEILLTHSSRIYEYRQNYLAGGEHRDYTAAEAAARALVVPITRYVDNNPSGVYYLQIAAVTTPDQENYPEDQALIELVETAMAHLGRAERNRRTDLAVGILFNSLVHIYQQTASDMEDRNLRNRRSVIEQLLIALSSFFSAPPANKT